MEFFSHASPRSGTARFTHLKVYSSYSLGVGVSSPAEICAHAARAGYRSVGLTDIGGTYGFVEFQIAARQNGIKPIYGIVVRHRSDARKGDEPSLLLLIAVSAAGLRNVAALASLSATEEEGAAVDFEVLGVHADGVVAATGSGDTEIARFLREGDTAGAEKAVGAFSEIYGERFFIEVQDHGKREERVLSEKLLALASRTGTAPLLTQEARYVDKRMRDLYGTLRGIRHPTEERDFFPADPDATDWSLKTPNEMIQLRPFYESAYDNSARIDDMIAGDLMEGMRGPGGTPEEAAESAGIRGEILDRCARAVKRRYGSLSEDQIGRWRSVLESEVDHAAAEGRGPALLLFHRVLTELREAGIDMGPATGLDLQTLCAHLLGITMYDPYRCDPGFHAGFDGRGGEAVEFELQLTPDTRAAAVRALFGMFDYGCVAFLPAIERVTPSKAVRMASAVSKVGPGEVEEIQEVLSRHPGLPLERIREIDVRLSSIYRRSLGAREVLMRAALLEDLPIGIVRSRRSLALSSAPLTDCLGCSIDSETGDLFIQAPRENFPVPGVHRVDVTSLGALGVCARAEEALRGARIADYAWDDLPLGEDDVWREVQRGDSIGIFLFEGQATLQLREELELKTITELTNFLALLRFRDGDQSLMDRIKAYNQGNRDSGDVPEKIRDILVSTRGHLLYQEQVRDVVSALTGIEAGEAMKMVRDLRSASPAELSAVRSRFMIGAADSDLPLDEATRWFERLMRHSRISISRKRVFADALLVYKLFLLKARHPAWFYAALLNAHLEGDGKLEKYIVPLRTRGIVLGVDVNRSRREFTVEDGSVRSGFCVVQGLTDEKIQRIEKARAKRPFESLDDFIRRVGARHLDRADARRLIETGAFDEFEASRAEMLARLQGLLGKRTAKARADARGQLEFPFDS
jgi:DNA polymerase-3 subunit alpha